MLSQSSRSSWHARSPPQSFAVVVSPAAKQRTANNRNGVPIKINSILQHHPYLPRVIQFLSPPWLSQVDYHLFPNPWTVHTYRFPQPQVLRLLPWRTTGATRSLLQLLLLLNTFLGYQILVFCLIATPTARYIQLI